MRTATKTYTIYKFNELSNDVQEKLLENEIERQKELFCDCQLFELMEDEARFLLGETFENSTFVGVCYDLSYCQGSGAMIEFTAEIDDMLTIKVRNYGHYCHEYSFDIEIDGNRDLFDAEKEYLKEKIIKMNKKLSRFGHGLLEDYSGFENCALYYLNGEEFLSDGTQWL